MKFNKNKAFTLIEMLIVVVIIGIILAIAIPNVSMLLNNRNRQLYNTHIRLLDKSVGLYVDKNKGELSNRSYSCFNINYKTLISEGFKETDIKCEGSVIVTKSNNDYNNNYYLTCYDNDNNIIVESDELPSGCSGFNDKFKMDYKIYTDSSKTTVYDESNYTKNAYIELSSTSPYATSISHYEYNLNLDNNWKKINSGTNLQDVEEIKNFSGDIYLRSVDNVGNTSDMSTVKVKLDNTGPKVEFAGYHEQSSNYLHIKFNVSDSLSGPDSYTKYSLKYSTTNGSYTNTVDSSLYNEYWPVENLTANTTYYYQFCAYDILGNETCITGTLQTKKACEYNLGTLANFYHTGGTQEFIVPCDGTYKLIVGGGAGGGGTTAGTGGRGGYTEGSIYLKKSTPLYITVGSNGGYGYGGYNGGGAGGSSNYARGGGGGATHIATGSINRGVLANYEQYKDEVLIVAGGGGGGVYMQGTSQTSAEGPDGGGGGSLNGKAGHSYDYLGNYQVYPGPGTQNSGGQGGVGILDNGTIISGNPGTFGQGGSGGELSAGGGGGWYGGGASGATTNYACSGGSGSAYRRNDILNSGFNFYNTTNTIGVGYARIDLMSYE